MENETEQEMYLLRLKGELERLDEHYDDIAVPSLSEFEQMIAVESERRRRQYRKELLLFWLVSLVLLSICLAVLGSAPAVYWALQAIIPAVGLAGLAASHFKRRRAGAGDE
ncbi:hypothetical protein GCM10010912_64830 [Paenibacillus albidus]|uniref:Uncharacterized protein n=1 Tax=Paenibacillus albidus TaxID=2041023 RepID=A0A917FWG2_9BACL|nr:YxlC family protein [Paenibacillus albidus]GGG11477.1 hypothetical protein GCM10010912_64830 [Paenibacillus albidus]